MIEVLSILGVVFVSVALGAGVMALAEEFRGEGDEVAATAGSLTALIALVAGIAVLL